jgi:hypothetical protein
VPLVLALAFALRLGAVALVDRQVEYSSVFLDVTESYRPIALSLLADGRYELHGSERDAARIMPGFPLYLAACYAVLGRDVAPWALAFLGCCWRLAAVRLGYEIAARAFGRVSARVTLLLLAADPWDVFWSGFVSKDALALTAFLWGMLKVVDLNAEGRARTALLAGAAIGGAVLVRLPNLGLLVPAGMALYNCARGSKRRLLASALAAGLVVAIGPWLGRNWIVFGEPALSPGLFGRWLYVGSGPRTTRPTSGYVDPKGLDVRPLEAIDQDPLRNPKAQGFSPLGSQIYLLGQAARHWVASPRETLTGIAANLWNMWRPTFAGASGPNVWVLGGGYLAQLSLVAFGLARARQRATSTGVLLLATALAFAAGSAVGLAEIRFRQFLMPLLLVWAGAGVAQVLTAANTASDRR